MSSMDRRIWLLLIHEEFMLAHVEVCQRPRRRYDSVLKKVCNWLSEV